MFVLECFQAFPGILLAITITALSPTRSINLVIFALCVFAALLLVLRRSFFGLQMRAVTQNRPMAAEMGIDTGRIDALTFGLGAGIAGLAAGWFGLVPSLASSLAVAVAAGRPPSNSGTSARIRS